ncbi:MAG: FAD-dependent oxidoreductase [Gammaproteobacteria bacterium]|nr:FAD-dependent oxidoreductase [Gammaproteobacteria bacterium]
MNVVVIGAGLGGLSAAAHLARAGLGVTVLEHHSVPGGYAHEFKRDDFRFEVALHALDGAGPGGWLYPILEELGIDLPMTRLDPLYQAHYPDIHITVPADLAEYQAQLRSLFPGEREGIDSLVEALRRVSHDVARYTLDRQHGERPAPFEMLERYPAMARAFSQTWSELLEGHIRDARLTTIFSTLWGYLGLPPSRVSAGLFALAWNSYHVGGGYYPVGGSQALSRAFEDVITRHAGEILYRQTVNGIVVRDGTAVAVTTERGLTVDADVVISNASPVDTMRFLGTDVLPDDYVQDRRADVPSLSTLVLYLGLDRDIRAEGWNAHEAFLSETFDTDADYAAAMSGDFSKASMVIADYTHTDPGCAPAGKSVVAMLTLAPWEYADTWGTGGDLVGYRRNPRYRALKRAAADILLARAERLIPGLQDSIEVMEIATPLTNHRYGLATRGSIYGREQTVDNLLVRISPKTPIPNVFLTGAWISGGGMSTAIASGRTAAEIVASRLR